MTRTTLLALLVALPAAAAPLPEHEAQRIAAARVYGTWTDPHGDATYHVAGGGLRVSFPARRRLPEADPRALYVTRFERAVEGDFTAVVRVSCPPQPAVQRDGPQTFVAAGLAAEDAAGNRCVIRRYERSVVGYWTQLAYQCDTADRSGGVGAVGGGKSPGPTMLRIARTGRFVEVAYTWDGEEWTGHYRCRMNWEPVVRVGPVAESRLGDPVEVTFDRFKLDVPKK